MLRDRFKRWLPEMPTPFKDRIQEWAAKVFAGVVVAAFIGSLIATLVVKGCS